MIHLYVCRLILTGKAKDRDLAYANANSIKQLDVHVLAIGIGFDGEKVSQGELNTIASSTDSVYIITEITPDFMMMVQKDICGRRYPL